MLVDLVHEFRKMVPFVLVFCLLVPLLCKGIIRILGWFLWCKICAICLSCAQKLKELNTSSNPSTLLFGDRQSSRDLSSMIRNDHMFDDQWRLADASDWGSVMSIQFPPAGSHLISSTLLSERTISSVVKRPPGLSKEALNQLHVEIFSFSEKSREHSTESKSQDCSICLEGFMEGDKLICLPCEHTFHSDCLDPWVQTCGDCPYCRKCITVPADRNYT